MKEVLIYGALIAAVLGASVPLINNLNATTSQQGQQINTAIGTQTTNLLNAVNTAAGAS